MKKVLIAVAVIAGASMMTSCKKDYTCTYDLLGTEATITYEGLKNSQVDDAKAGCTLLGGTWATK